MHTVFVLAHGKILWSAASAFRRFALGAEMRAVVSAGLGSGSILCTPLLPRLCSVQGAVLPAEQSPTPLTTSFRVALWLAGGGGCTAPRREACRACRRMVRLGGGQRRRNMGVYSQQRGRGALPRKVQSQR